jgi:phage terminase small subunit
MIRERILVYGQPGSGKSYAHLKIAEGYPRSKFYVIDTDDSMPRMLNGEFSHLANVEAYAAQDWAGCCKALDDIKPNVTSEDWLVVDMLCSVWDFVQSFFVEEIFGQDIASYFLQARKELKQGASSLSALRGWTDWGVINKLYQTWINEIAYRLPCHVFFTCKATRVGQDDEADIRDMYSTFGVRPEGEKRNTYRVHSVFLLTHDRNGFYMSTVKDRGRVRLENTSLTPEQNFATKYLQLFAGWEKG